jgi:hypothetical protein
LRASGEAGTLPLEDNRSDAREHVAMPETSAKLALYASVGNELTHYDVDVAEATLTRRSAAKLPANVQYA